MNFKFLIVIFILIGFSVKSQNIAIKPVDLSDVRLRNEQLLGRTDSLVSFCSLPLPEGLIDNKIENNSDISSKKIVTKILPITFTQQYNTFSPMGWNDGAMIPAKGYQMLLNAGLYASYKALSVQFKPEYVFADNPNFETFPLTETYNARFANINYLNKSDLPERFGDRNYQYLGWGQSSISLAINKFSVGLSTENLWWGPGQRNSLVMSNNAPGFLHFTINTRKPIKTFIGSFEGQLVNGKLENSGIESPDAAYILDGVNLKEPKIQEWRYFSGITINYQPKWIPGLFVGMNRIFHLYHTDLGNSFSDYFPVIIAFQKKNLPEEESKKRDQVASLFLRWVFKESKFEFYFENGWNDHSSTIWDLFDSPEHSRAYLFGFSKIFILNSNKDNYFKFNFENTQTQQSADRIVRTAESWYIHGTVRQGYTNIGQVMGAGIGPSSNLQTLDFSVWNKGRVWGIQCERYAHNLDFYYDAYPDYNHKWVDLNFKTYAYRRFGNLGVQGKINAAWMRNYEWQLNNNRVNMQAQITLQYNF